MDPQLSFLMANQGQVKYLSVQNKLLSIICVLGFKHFADKIKIKSELSYRQNMPIMFFSFS